MILRDAKLEDAPAISAILSDWISETHWMPRVHSEEEERGFGRFLIERTEVTVADDRGQVVAFLARRGAQIEALYVAPEARDQDVGKALMQRAMLGHKKVSVWCFQANLRALRFYAALGFKVARRTDGSGNDEKMPDVLLERTLEAV